MVSNRLITVGETPLFVRQASAVWSDEERVEFVNFIAENPEIGDVIPDTGGVRKVRWARAGSGKRGGARVIYFYPDPGRPLYLLMVYAKGRQEDMSPDEKRLEHDAIKRNRLIASCSIFKSLERVWCENRFPLFATRSSSTTRRHLERVESSEKRARRHMSKFGQELIKSLTEAVAHAEGRDISGMRLTTVELPDVRAIRRGLHMSQNRFSLAFRIPLATLKNWEQGRRNPDAPAAAYLRAIQRRPKEIMDAVAD